MQSWQKGDPLMRWSQAGQIERSQALHRALAPLVGWKMQFISAFTSRSGSGDCGACPDSADPSNRGPVRNAATLERRHARDSAPKKSSWRVLQPGELG